MNDFLNIINIYYYLILLPVWLWRSTLEPQTTERGSTALLLHVGTLYSLVVKMGWRMSGTQTQVRIMFVRSWNCWQFCAQCLQLSLFCLLRWPSCGLLRALLPHHSPRRFIPPSREHGRFLCLWSEPAGPRVPVRSQRFVQTPDEELLLSAHSPFLGINIKR